MATITTASLVHRGIPSGTTLGVYDGASIGPGQDPPPRAAAITTAATDAAGAFTATNAGILQGRDYVLWAAGLTRAVRCRSTLDVQDVGRGVGNGTLTTGSKVVNPLTATSGAFATGQRIAGASGAPLPPGTYIVACATDRSGKAVTAAAATDVFTLAAHNLQNGDPVVLSAMTGGTGLTAGVVYYVRKINENTFALATSPGGLPVDITADLTAGTLTGIALLSENALVTGSTALVGEGASPPATPANAGVGANPNPVVQSTVRAQLRQRRQLAGTI